MSELLRISGITKIYETAGKKVVGVENVSFSVDEGEFISIIGPSGCGKSTLLRCIAGFEKISSGSVTISEKTVTKPGPDRFMIFQGLDQLFPWLTVAENIKFAMSAVRGKNLSGGFQEDAERYLEMVGLSGCGGYYPYQLSGGMKQRASIARALSVNPRVLLMDEPFGSLDAFSRRAVHQMLVKVWESTGITIIFVTHDVEEAVDLSDRILVFSPGRLRADVANPLSRPRKRNTEAYRDFMNKLGGLLDGGIKEISEPAGLAAPEVNLAY